MVWDTVASTSEGNRQAPGTKQALVSLTLGQLTLAGLKSDNVYFHLSVDKKETKQNKTKALSSRTIRFKTKTNLELPTCGRLSVFRTSPECALIWFL